MAAAPVAPAAAAAHGHHALVQLAAVGSNELAMQEWERLAKKYPDVFAGRSPTISKTEHAGKTYWRVRTGGFADAAQATAFCGKLKAKGGTCQVTSL